MQTHDDLGRRFHTPQTNSKAERFIQTGLREWAYAQPFQTSADRAAAMLPWITEYNASRPHSALNGMSPLARRANLTTLAVAKPRDTADTEPRFVATSGVKPREATAEGGLGLTPDMATQAKSVIGGDNLLGSNI